MQSACQPSGSLPEEQVLTWISQILDALEYLHRQDPPIIHRDIKPANIRITPKGRAMLVDFGIAKDFQPGAQDYGWRSGSYTRLFPARNNMVRARPMRVSDIYALGATLYVLLTGQTPPESTARAWNDPLQPAPNSSIRVCLLRLASPSAKLSRPTRSTVGKISPNFIVALQAPVSPAVVQDWPH